MASYTSVLGVLLSYVLLYKYFTLFLAIFLAGIIVPIPASELLMAVGAFSGQGYLNFWLALLAGLSGNVLGDLVDYSLAKRYGPRLIRRFRLNRIKFIDQLEAEVRRDAPFMIFATRIAGALGPAVSVLSGVSGVSLKKFLLYDVTGNLVDIGGLLLIGYTVGSYWENLSDIAGIVIAILVVAIVMFILWRISQRIFKRTFRYHDEQN